MKEEEERKIREEEERKIREEERKIKEEEERKMKEEVKEGVVENLQVGLMNSMQDLLKEVKSQVGDLSEEDEELYLEIRKGMRKQDQDEETMRRYEEELRKILKK